MDAEKIKQYERVARIMGPSSASALALAEYRRRRAGGEDVEIFQTGRTLIVGPSPAPNT